MNRILIMLFTSIFILNGSGVLAKDSTWVQQLFIKNPALAYQPEQIKAKEDSVAFTGMVKMNQKSRGKAFLMSLLIPGLGERYAGAKTKSDIFMIAEIGLWLTYAGFISYREWREKDYKTFAASHAQVDLEGKPSSYFIDIGNYNNIHEYNAAKLRQRNLPEYYHDEQKNFWQWDTETNRSKFEDLRIDADRAHNYSLFAVGAILANHLLSAIDAMWTIHSQKDTKTSAVNMNFKVGETVEKPAILLSFQAKF